MNRALLVAFSFRHLGTSNWEGDYFTATAGVSIILNDTVPSPPQKSGRRINARDIESKVVNFTTVRDQLESAFLRDWDSKYAVDVTI